MIKLSEIAASNIWKTAIIALGLLIISPGLILGESEDDLKSMAISMTVGGRSMAMKAPAFSGNRAYEHLKKQCSFGSRVPGSKAHNDCLYWMVGELHKYAQDVTLQMFKSKPLGYTETVQMTNVIARFNVKSEERLLLAAHWDTRPWADKDPDMNNRNKPVPGANDGASGVAVLLHAAELFRKNPPPIGIDLVLLDGEDSGTYTEMNSWCLGAQEFVKRMKTVRIPPKAGILLDMIGDKNLNIKRELNSIAASSEMMDRIWAAASALGIDAFKRETMDGIIDDHVFLTAGGIPTVDIIDFEYGDKNNSLWHTLMDRPENCSAESLEAVGKVLMRVVYSGAGFLKSGADK